MRHFFLAALFITTILTSAMVVAPAYAATSKKPAACVIKGNINAKKEKIYHLPYCPSYKATKIDKPGERYFCTEQEAVRAGWRKAGNCR